MNYAHWGSGNPVYRKTLRQQWFSLGAFFWGGLFFIAGVFNFFTTDPTMGLFPFVLGSGLLVFGKKTWSKSQKAWKAEKKAIDDFNDDIDHKEYAILQHNYEKAMRERDEAISKLNERQEPVKSNEKEV